MVRIQNKISTFPKINFNFFSKLEKKIESFFQGIEKRIISYKVLREEEKKRSIIQKLEREEKEKTKSEIIEFGMIAWSGG